MIDVVPVRISSDPSVPAPYDALLNWQLARWARAQAGLIAADLVSPAWIAGGQVTPVSAGKVQVAACEAIVFEVVDQQETFAHRVITAAQQVTVPTDRPTLLTVGFDPDAPGVGRIEVYDVTQLVALGQFTYEAVPQDTARDAVLAEVVPPSPGQAPIVLDLRCKPFGSMVAAASTYDAVPPGTVKSIATNSTSLPFFQDGSGTPLALSGLYRPVQMGLPYPMRVKWYGAVGATYELHVHLKAGVNGKPPQISKFSPGADIQFTLAVNGIKLDVNTGDPQGDTPEQGGFQLLTPTKSWQHAFTSGRRRFFVIGDWYHDSRQPSTTEQPQIDPNGILDDTNALHISALITSTVSALHEFCLYARSDDVAWVHWLELSVRQYAPGPPLGV